MSRRRLAPFTLAVAMIASPCQAQSAKKPAPVDRQAIERHRTAVNDAVKDATKADVEDAQSRLDAAVKDFKAWRTENKVLLGDKSLAALVRTIERKQEDLNRLRGSPPKRKEFEPFIGKWKSDEGDFEISINEFGTGTYRASFSGEFNVKVFGSIAQSIEVDEEGKAFQLASSGPGMEIGSFTLDGEESISVHAKVTEIKLGGGIARSAEKDFVLKRTSKTPDKDTKLKIPKK